MDHFKLLSLQSEFPNSDGIGYEGLGDGRGTEEEAIDGRDEHGTELVADYLRLVDEDLQGVVSKLRFALQEAYIQLAKSEEARRAIYQENVALKKALTLHLNLQLNANRFDLQPQSTNPVSKSPYTVSAARVDTGSTNASPKPEQHPAPKTPKTWAELAASNKSKWGNPVAQDTHGAFEVLSSSSVKSGQETPISSHISSHGGKPQGSEHHPLYIAATQVITAQCFITGVTEAVTEPLLVAALSKFGALKGKPDVVHFSGCAFVEFGNVESAKRAIISSLNTSAGGDGGVWIDVSSNPNAGAAGGATDPARPGQIRVFVETMKERDDWVVAGRRGRPVNRRGGAPQGGQHQGGQQGQVDGDGNHRIFRGRGRGRSHNR